MKDNIIWQKIINKSRDLIYEGESPFSAGILLNNKLLIAGNKSRTLNNPSLHAEIVCINEFCEKFDFHQLSNAVIYTNCEPCLMCLHYIYNSGIKSIKFAVPIEDAIKYGSGDLPISIKDYANNFKLDIHIAGPFMRNKAIDVFKECIDYRGEL